MNYLYALIVDYYNTDYGYAFPNKIDLAREYGKTEKTTGAHLDVLQEVGLIKIIKTHANNRYVPYLPLQFEDFLKQHADGKANYYRAIKAAENEKARSKRNLGAFHSLDNNN